MKDKIGMIAASFCLCARGALAADLAALESLRPGDRVRLTLIDASSFAWQLDAAQARVCGSGKMLRGTLAAVDLSASGEIAITCAAGREPVRVPWRTVRYVNRFVRRTPSERAWRSVRVGIGTGIISGMILASGYMAAEHCCIEGYISGPAVMAVPSVFASSIANALTPEQASTRKRVVTGVLVGMLTGAAMGGSLPDTPHDRVTRSLGFAAGGAAIGAVNAAWTTRFRSEIVAHPTAQVGLANTAPQGLGIAVRWRF
ncbi:MAG: hypothetical protein MUF51_08605 [Vicinamibacteria bacterium]|nr:hypothetical protein [Vicinamibacteria bacterium]